MTEPTVQDTPTSQKFFMLDVEYKAKQSVVVAANNQEEAVDYARASIPPFIEDFTVTKVEEKTGTELEELFSTMAEAQTKPLN
jgi:hypothetical protein